MSRILGGNSSTFIEPSTHHQRSLGTLQLRKEQRHEGQVSFDHLSTSLIYHTTDGTASTVPLNSVFVTYGRMAITPLLDTLSKKQVQSSQFIKKFKENTIAAYRKQELGQEIEALRTNLGVAPESKVPDLFNIRFSTLEMRDADKHFSNDLKPLLQSVTELRQARSQKLRGDLWIVSQTLDQRDQQLEQDLEAGS
ncbi:MAG: hypothetical protein J3Q66DRAFT_398781 [Benniella sp.]|nr:MAG: hypothetical protein J3Q66DRAFT_398781 [Benniella sp.]